MLKKRIIALLILLAGFGIGFFVYTSELAHMTMDKTQAPTGVAKYPFKLGLDLSGGTHLVYLADVSDVNKAEVGDAMNSLREVIERRINIFGVSEPIVTVIHGGVASNGEERLSVDLPGVTDVKKAIDMIGQTPMLEFRTENLDKNAPQKATVDAEGNLVLDMDSQYVPTALTGRYLEKATVEFNPTTGEPVVSLQFDSEGSDLFQQITKDNIGKTIAIYLDGQAISAPRVNESISGGKAQISGDFTPEEAKLLVGRLNSGALPIPISLVSTETIGPTLGTEATHAGVKAAIIGFLAIAIFLIIWYRLPGFIAVLSLSIYTVTMLAIFKLMPVTLTAAGIAGFIISIGLAVDANVLIFERIKEELREGNTVSDAIVNGFKRAWLSVRDSNFSSLITGVLLYWFGTSLIKGFALVFVIGVLVSMISAVFITRLFLYTLNVNKNSRLISFLFGSGLSSARAQK